jgi:hypothetical protein
MRELALFAGGGEPMNDRFNYPSYQDRFITPESKKNGHASPQLRIDRLKAYLAMKRADALTGEDLATDIFRDAKGSTDVPTAQEETEAGVRASIAKMDRKTLLALVSKRWPGWFKSPKIQQKIDDMTIYNLRSRMLTLWRADEQRREP